MIVRRLTLMRHAKSSHAGPSQPDHDRPLSARGERDAPLMARRLIDRGGRPSLILTSTAARARQTARLFAQAIGYPIEFIQSERELYLAPPAGIVDIIAGQDDAFHDIVVCAHNPGITELAAELGRRPIDNVPTCGMVILDIRVDTWDELRPARCEFVDFDYPKRGTA